MWEHSGTSPDPQRKSDQDHRIKLAGARDQREKENEGKCPGEVGPDED